MSRITPGQPGDSPDLADGATVRTPAKQTRVEAEAPNPLAELRTRGYRLTPQRQLVLEAVGQLGHATPEQVLTAVQLRVAAVNVSTVYRTLTLLEELGLVRHTHLGHGASSFSLAAELEHVHLVCRDCGGVQELPAETLSDVAGRLLEHQRFTVDIGHTTLFGRCRRCSEDVAEPGRVRAVGLH